MKTAATVKVAALIGAAVIMALFTVQGTLALWSASTASTGQLLQSADFTVDVASAGGTGRLDPVQTITMPPVTGMTPGTSRTVPVTVTNSTQAGSGTFKTRITAGAPQVSGPLAGYVTGTVRPSLDAACSSIETGNSLDLPQGASGVFCVSMTMSPDAPATLGGSTAAVTVALTAQQQP